MAVQSVPPPLVLGQKRLDLSQRPHILGIINVTPDSFYDGGRYFNPQAAIERGIQLWQEGADFLEVGGEAAGPGEPISSQEEIERVVPIVRELALQVDIPISIDTYKYPVAKAALEAGATILNDTQSLRDSRMGKLAAREGAALVLIHFPGNPRETPRAWRYKDVMGHILAFLGKRVEKALDAGVPKSKIILDPGFGFHKTGRQDLEVLRRLPELTDLDHPIMVGTSHRGFIGYATGLPLGERLEATAATVAYSILQGAHIIRVHDVRYMARVARMSAALMKGQQSL